jgi:ketosteroid isomerase-like protein
MNEQRRTKQQEVEALIHFGRLWDEAMVNNDADEIGKFMAADWVIVGTEGGITSKSSFLDGIRSGDLMHTRMDSDDSRVQLYGNTGVVTSRGTSSGKYKGQPFSFYEWSTSIYIREKGKWRCVLTMLTPVKNQEGSSV